MKDTNSEPYIGSVRFFKNIILVVVIILILVPTVLFIRSKSKLKKAEADSEQLRAELEVAQAIEEPRTATITDKKGNEKEIIIDENDNPNATYFNMKTEAMEYQKLYPDLYAPQPLQATNKVENTVYLTFNGGPTFQTEAILEKLAKYNVKATFFVNGGADEDNAAMMKKIVEQGHTLGIYSSTADYEALYSSVESYLEDANTVYQQIAAATGVKPSIIRFPGGSANAYNKAIYQELIAEMLRRDFVPCDWNVQAMSDSSGLTADDIAVMAIDGSDGIERPFISLLDSEDSATADALGAIIERLEAKGYEFKAIQPDTMPILFSYPN